MRQRPYLLAVLAACATDATEAKPEETPVVARSALRTPAQVTPHQQSLIAGAEVLTRHQCTRCHVIEGLSG